MVRERGLHLLSLERAVCSEHELADTGGIAITLGAVKTAEILPLMGADGLLRLQLLYPYALLLKQPQLGLSEQTSNSWSQTMLYAQWVLYGLYISIATRWKPLWTTLVQVAAIHLLGFGVLWLLARN